MALESGVYNYSFLMQTNEYYGRSDSHLNTKIEDIETNGSIPQDGHEQKWAYIPPSLFNSSLNVNISGEHEENFDSNMRSWDFMNSFFEKE